MRLPSEHRVAVYRNNHDLRLETRAVPALHEGELLLQVTASGICGSDLMEWYRVPKAPLVLGHEVCGRVVAIGEGANGFHMGDRVVATHHVPCLTCGYCASGRETMCDMLRRTSFDPGGFAEFVRVPAINVQHGVFALPEQVSDDAGSMVEPLGCALRGQRKAGVGEGHAVLIIGAGVSGAFHLLAARARGVERVYMADIEPTRRDAASRLGADGVFDADESLGARVHEALGRGADRVIVCTGARAAVTRALAAVDRGGSVLFFAPMGPGEAYSVPFDEVFWRSDVTLTSSYGAAPRDLREALDIMARGQVDVMPLITHRLPLEAIQRGFELMLAARDSLKIIVDPRAGPAT